MTPERYEQIGQLYQRALERQPAERAAFLADACGADETLCLEVTSLLAAHEEASTFMAQPPEDVAAGVAYLGSDDASFVTGHNLVISGGRGMG